MQKLIGRPKTNASILEELNIEITAAALEGVELTAEERLRVLFRKIALAASFAQSVNRGLRTKKHEPNHDLLRFLNGEENLN